MLIVEIYINTTLIGKETALRVKGGVKSSDINTYELGSNKKRIKHCYGDGAAALAEKMMENLKRREKIWDICT